MLPARAWKTEAIVRLLAGVFLCIFAGALAAAVLQYARSGVRLDPKVFLVAVAAIGFLGVTLVLIHKPWRFEDGRQRLVAVVVCFYAGLLLGAWAHKVAGSPDSSVATMLIGTVSFQGAALVLVAGFTREHQVNWTEVFGFNNQARRAMLYGIVLACVFLPLGWGLQWLSAETLTRLPHWKVTPSAQEAVQTLRLASSWLHRVALGAVTIFLAPVAEEILFRGILYPWIKQVGFPRLALWATALLFAAVHLNLATFLPLLVLALALAGLYEFTGNLLAPIAAHSLFNAFNFTMLYLLERAGP